MHILLIRPEFKLIYNSALKGTLFYIVPNWPATSDNEEGDLARMNAIRNPIANKSNHTSELLSVKNEIRN